MNKNLVKNDASKKQFRTRYIYACKQKVPHIEALQATSKYKAIQVGLNALKRTPSPVKAKKSVTFENIVSSPEVNGRSYAKVVQVHVNTKNTKSKPPERVHMASVRKLQNANTTGTERNCNGHTGLGHSKEVKNQIDNETTDQYSRANDIDNTQKVKSQECKIFDINGLDDKFLHFILNITSDKKSWRNANSEVTKAWRSQTDFEFGFIPLGELHEASSGVINELPNYCPITAHNIVANSGKPNFQQARIKVETQLHLDEWQKQLQGYWDTQLIDLLMFGFPLDFNRASPLRWEGENHKSAIDYPEDIEAYLAEEKSFNAIVDPFKDHPCPNGHISSFMSREKPEANTRCVIIDLSWPLGQSVNSGIDKTSYLGTDFSIVLPIVDHITDKLKTLGRGAHIYTIDISRAFRHIKVDPLDYHLLGLHWRHVYVDTCVPFGSCHGSQIFQRVSDAVRFMMRRAGHSIINYVGFGVPTDAKRSYDHLYDLLDRLGLTISQKKLVPPSTSVVCLGVQIDTEKGSISIPQAKLRQICDTVKEWENKKYCTKRQLQSLLGHLLYIHKCVKPARYFLNRMLQLLREHHGRVRIHLNHEFHRDLRWFQRFLPLYNGVSMYDHKQLDHQVHLDACLKGLGGLCIHEYCCGKC